MIYSLGHGRKPFTSSTSEAALSSLSRTFRYYKPSAPTVSANTKTVNDLVALGLAMTDPNNFPAKQDADIPAVYTYFGQFIDHDLSAGTDALIEIEQMNDMMSGKGPFDPAKVEPQDRSTAENGVVNQNTGMLDLDSLYGDVLIHSDFDRKFAATLRAKASKHAGKMQVAFPSPDPQGPIEPPKDGANDLLRLGGRLDKGLDSDELVNLPVGVRNLFLKNSDPHNPDFNKARALIGDSRNDENLFVAQVHLAWLRLHNAIVDACEDPNVIKGGSDALFEYAKERTRWTYQWVVLNDFLPMVCDADSLDQVRQSGAALYDWFRNSTGGSASNSLPLPMEFSVAAYRFGHTMVREAYDWNDNFQRSSLKLLFEFTGSAKSSRIDERLPGSWPADFSRTALPHPKGTLRTTRAIDTNLSIQLAMLPPAHHETEGSETDPRKNLAVRNLIKGYQLNLPSAQEVAKIVAQATGVHIQMLDPDDIPNPGLVDQFAGTHLKHETPLWYYVLREAEVLSNGEKLGPLGTHIVASTMLGVTIADPDSYFHQDGSDAQGRWQPKDMPAPNKVSIGSLADVLRAALVLN